MGSAEHTTAPAAAPGGSANQESKFLTFQLGDTEFGIEILKVVEILKMMEITTVPMWPAFAKGTINLRGKVIPVVDLRMKFGLSATELTEHTCTIVVELGGAQIGVVVEAVNEVQEFPPQKIEKSPDIGGTVNSDFILGMGQSDGGTVILLHLEKILLDGSMGSVLGGQVDAAALEEAAALDEADIEDFEPQIV